MKVITNCYCATEMIDQEFCNSINSSWCLQRRHPRLKFSSPIVITIKKKKRFEERLSSSRDRKLTFSGTNACYEVGIEMTIMLK